MIFSSGLPGQNRVIPDSTPIPVFQRQRDLALAPVARLFAIKSGTDITGISSPSKKISFLLAYACSNSTRVFGRTRKTVHGNGVSTYQKKSNFFF